jgi:hypothetical protein
MKAANSPSHLVSGPETAPSPMNQRQCGSDAGFAAGEEV